MPLLDRLFRWGFLQVVAGNQFLGTWIRGFVHVWFNGEEPNPDETISSWVGRCSRDGFRLGRIAEKVIDFFLNEGHCRRAIGK